MSDLLGARMRLAIHVLQPLHTSMRINLRGRNGSVAEQLLNGPQIGAGIQKVGGERVAEGVSREAGVLVDAVEKSGDRALDCTE